MHAKPCCVYLKMIALTFEITKHESSEKNNDTVGAARCEFQNYHQLN